jgi:hypothetical protein
VSWLKVDDGYPDHPKIHALRADAAVGMALDTAGKCYASRHRTDGLVPAIVVPRLVLGLRRPLAIAERLVEVGLWEREGEDYRIHDYLDYNPSRADLESRREARSQAGAAGADARWHGKSDGNSDGKPDSTLLSHGNAPHPTPTSPVDISPLRPVAVADSWDVFETYYSLTNRFPAKGSRLRDWLYTIGERFGQQRASQMIAAKFRESSDLSTLLGRVDSALAAEAHAADKAERAAETKRNAAKRAPLDPFQRELYEALLKREQEGAA